MKNAKDYIEETSPNTPRIRVAYWLTPEGLDNPLFAKLLRKSIATATDEDFKEAFDGATKAEAALHLERWELCYMGQWGAPELAKAIVLSDAGRDEALALRAVSMAQSGKELPEVFTPKEGIQWAMARGYLIGRNICAWCGVTPGSYGHPSNPLSTADAPAGEVKAEPVATPAPAIKTNKLRRNNLDPAIEKAIKKAGNKELADVYLELKALALVEEKPFTGALDGDALCYTDDNNQPAKLPKEALGKRLKRR